MKKKYVLLICFLCLYAGYSLAQKTRLKYFGIETGFSSFNNKISNMDYIRGDIITNFGENPTSSIVSSCDKAFVGINYEILSLNDRFGFSVGIRYSGIYSSIDETKILVNNKDYFYCLYSQNGVITEYLKVKEINQSSDYLGIPLEIKCFPSIRPYKAQIYFKIGSEINFLIHTKKDVVFSDNAMDAYKDGITAKVDQPKTFYSAIYSGFGIRIGKDVKPSLCLELCYPYLFLTPGSFGLVQAMSGGGFKLNFQLPVKSKI